MNGHWRHTGYKDSKRSSGDIQVHFGWATVSQIVKLVGKSAEAYERWRLDGQDVGQGGAAQAAPALIQRQARPVTPPPLYPQFERRSYGRFDLLLRRARRNPRLQSL